MEEVDQPIEVALPPPSEYHEELRRSQLVHLTVGHWEDLQTELDSLRQRVVALEAKNAVS